MKKLLALAVLAAALASQSVLAQGNFVFGSGARYVWDNWSGVASPTGNFTNYTAFLWGSGTPLVDSIATSVPTNNMSTHAVQVTSTAWNDILTDPSFHFATNNSSGLLVGAQTTLTGGVSYNGGSAFPVLGTSSAGGSTTVFVVAWSVGYTDPAAAAAANAPLGWSAPFSYTYASSSGSPTSFSAQNTTWQFGVSPIPEPSTFALAGLGAAALMIFRRKK